MLLSGQRAVHSVDNVFSFILTDCNFSYFPFWFWVRDLGSDCTGFWPLLTCYFGIFTKIYALCRPGHLSNSVIWKNSYETQRTAQ